MIYLLALATAFSLGILTIRLIVGPLVYDLDLLLGAILGLGFISQMIFYLQLVGQHFNHFLSPIFSLLLCGILFWFNRNSIKKPSLLLKNKSLWILLVLALPLWSEAHFFHMGGWDAWSCWNLKAKFIYLGENHWKDMFDPILWRSNTGYPLALPTMNVWFWQWTGFSQNVLMLNAIVLTLLTAGTLLLGLQSLNVRPLSAILLTLAVFTLAFGNTLCISQYSDILFSLDLLAAFVCYLLFDQSKNPRLLLLTALFIGLLSFTKNEGLAASAILTILILIQRPSKPWIFIGLIFLAALPTFIFILTMAPKSEAFINGLISAQKPSTFERLEFILVYTFSEFISLKWMGIWIVATLGIGFGLRKAFTQPFVLIGTFTALYLAIVLGYYQINTFFENINWWMDFTLNRILFALMPSIFLWIGVSLFSSKKD